MRHGKRIASHLLVLMFGLVWAFALGLSPREGPAAFPNMGLSTAQREILAIPLTCLRVVIGMQQNQPAGNLVWDRLAA